MDRSRLIIIPAYNEEGTIGDIVRQSSSFGHVLVVDDCSSDGTVDLARTAGAEVLVSQKNGGYENTLNRGFAYAIENNFENIVTIDADGEHDPSLLGGVFDALTVQSKQLVLGVRPRKQRFAEVVMGWYFNRAFGVHDILCGMKGYKLAILRDSDVPGGAYIGTGAAIEALKHRASFHQIKVWGKPRVDSPRFGNRIRGNIKIFKVFFTILFNNLKSSEK